MSKAFDYMQVPLAIVATDLTGAPVEVEGAYFRVARLMAIHGPMTLVELRDRIGTVSVVERSLNWRSTDAEPLLSFRWLEEWRERANAARERTSRAGNASAEKRAKKKKGGNKRSTSVEHTSHSSSTNVEHATILSSTIKTDSGKERASDLPFPSQAFADAFEAYTIMRDGKKKPMTAYARKLIIADLTKMGEADAITSLNNSTRGGWTDVYPLKTGKGALRPTAPTPNTVFDERV